MTRSRDFVSPSISTLVGGALIAALASSQVALAQAPPKASSASPQGDTWASIAKLPDWGGIWEVTFGGGARGGPRPEGPALTPAYEAKLKEYQDAQKRGEIQDTPAANCVPSGMPVNFSGTSVTLQMASSNCSAVRRRVVACEKYLLSSLLKSLACALS